MCVLCACTTFITNWFPLHIKFSKIAYYFYYSIIVSTIINYFFSFYARLLLFLIYYWNNIWNNWMASSVVCIRCHFYLDYICNYTTVWKSPHPHPFHSPWWRHRYGRNILDFIQQTNVLILCLMASLFFYSFEAIWCRRVQSFLVVPLALDLFLGQGRVCMVKVEVCHAILRAKSH